MNPMVGTPDPLSGFSRAGRESPPCPAPRRRGDPGPASNACRRHPSPGEGAPSGRAIHGPRPASCAPLPEEGGRPPILRVAVDPCRGGLAFEAQSGLWESLQGGFPPLAWAVCCPVGPAEPGAGRAAGDGLLAAVRARLSNAHQAGRPGRCWKGRPGEPCWSSAPARHLAVYLSKR